MIVRLILFALLVLVAGYGFSWLADRPGELSLVFDGRIYETRLIVAAAALLLLIGAVMAAWWLLRTIWTSPHAVGRFFRARKRDRGYQALSTGLIAAGAGNALLARKMAARARGLIRADQEPLILLLEAQAALIEGRHDEARSSFEAMAQDPETRELGLRGLYLEAKRLGADEAARQYAEQAADKAPYLAWAAQATLEHRSQSGRYDDAIRLLDQQKAARVIEKPQADRLRAVLLTAKAGQELEANPVNARHLAQSALKLAPDLVPAAVIAAKALFQDGKLRRAASVLEDAWKAKPHPEIGRVYVRARSGDSAQDRLKRAERLEALRPNNIESLLVLAEAALAAKDFPRARMKAEAAARMEPREAAFLLLADIEEAETGDQGRIRHWLGQALKAPRDPAWVADGFVSEKWLPVSPVTGKLDAFEWKQPFGQLAGPLEEGEAQPIDAALKSLPPRDLGTAAPQRREEAEAVAPAKSLTVSAVADDRREAPPTERSETRPALKPAASPVTPPPAALTPGERSEPFFGHAPDDPGVRDQSIEPEPKTRLRLF